MSSSKEFGYIDKFYRGVGKVVGLSDVFLHEILKWENGKSAAIVIGYSVEYIEVLFLHPNEVNYNNKLFRTKKPFKIAIGEDYLGRVVNGFGEPIDGLGVIKGTGFSEVFKESPGIIERDMVDEPLFTGISVIDTVLPIGRGQRELIIGDKKLGKSSIAIDAFINQKNNKINDMDKVFGVYVVVGQKKDKVDEVVQTLRDSGILEQSVIVVGLADDSLVAQYLAPYVGCTISEYFRDKGEDSLIVYDDLSKHAKAYREISLLLERSPGREAYPGDIFYLHASLLERACKLSKSNGGGSLTALPIVETLENDITAFIPTNLISITDGQIYLDSNLFSRGSLPAINIGLSVSRVGSQAQTKLLKSVSKSLKLVISQYYSLKKLVQLESSLHQVAEKQFKRGALTIEALRQNQGDSQLLIEEVIIFYGLSNDLFDIETKDWAEFKKKFIIYLRSKKPDTLKKILSMSEINAGKQIKNIISKFNL